MTPLAPADSTRPLWFRATPRRLLLTALLALVGFLFPQEMPLVWYPLNEPGQDVLYLEIACASNQTGDVQIFYDATHGINDRNSIRFPISPTARTYTYTFPLPDAPIRALRLDPVGDGGTLTIRQMRIIDRRGIEKRRFTADMFVADSGIASIEPVTDGWKITSQPNPADPYLHIQLDCPIVAKDINQRNFLRCLYSTSYLALMLWILLLAVLFAFYRPRSWRDAATHLGFMAAIAVMFSFVGNRGLIKNSVRYARFQAVPVTGALYLEMELNVRHPTSAQFFWDTGAGYNEKENEWRDYAFTDELQIVRATLPAGPLRAFRFDPLIAYGHLSIRHIRITDGARRTQLVLPLDSFEALREVDPLRIEHDRLLIEVPAGNTDPILQFTPAAIAAVNRALAAGPQP